jgi:hypothetical protein
MSAPRLERRLLLFTEVVARINRRDARATLGLVEDEGNRTGGKSNSSKPVATVRRTSCRV